VTAVTSMFYVAMMSRSNTHDEATESKRNYDGPVLIAAKRKRENA
jgi:hypothetical protein